MTAPSDSAKSPITAAIVATPESSASTLFGVYDVFCSAGRDWDFITTGVPGKPAIKPYVVAETTQTFIAANGVPITPQISISDCPSPQIICIPDLHTPPGESIAGRYGPTVEWLRACHDRGATLTAACSGSLLLGEAGLLDGCDATTHWGFTETMAREYPQVKIHPSRALVAAGTGQRLITAGGGTSWQDLALYLVARFLGQEEAMRIAKIYLFDWHHHGQLPYATLARNRQVEDNCIAVSQEWIADHYAEAGPVSTMAALSGLAERSFKRRFRKATGMTPLDYVQTLRLEEAKQMLETSDLPIESIANEVGYEDASFFRRLFRRKVGMSPGDYRRRFSAFRKVLETAAV